MTEHLARTTLARWRRDPIRFIEQVLVDPESKRPFVLLPAEVAFLKHAFQLNDDGRLAYSELLYACPKKSGKTTFAGIVTLTLLLLYGGTYPEATICANDYDQSVARVFTMIRRIVECSPALRTMAKITADTISFPELKATISAIPSDAAGAAGGNQNIAVFDEIWGAVSERSRRLYDEMVPPPTRKIACRLTVTYAGWLGESVLLEELYKRGLQQPLIGPDLHAGDGLLMFWSHTPIAPWQTDAWLRDMKRSLRPSQYARMILNEWVSTESSFIDLAAFDRCVDLNYRPVLTDHQSQVFVAVDASTKHDSTAIVAVTYDREQQRARLLNHRIFTPTPERPIDFEASIESTLLSWQRKYRIKACLFDPFQMAAVSQRLIRDGIKMLEFPQTVPNLTAAAENLFELIRGGSLMVYPDQQIRTAISQTVAIESSRGWRIGKEKQSHKIDVIVALAMASLMAVRSQKRRDTRSFMPLGADGMGELIEVDPVTRRPLDQPQQGRLVRGADGNLHIVGSDNGCWTEEELKKKRRRVLQGLY